MIEAVNATVANAAVLRPATEQVDVARSYASNPERIQEAAPQAPYVSPYISWNKNYNKAVLQLRNGETGEVEREFPSDSVLASRARLASTAEAPAPRQQTQTDTSGDTGGGVTFTSSAGKNTASAPAPQQANVAQAQVAAAALVRSAQAAVPQVSTVVTSA